MSAETRCNKHTYMVLCRKDRGNWFSSLVLAMFADVVHATQLVNFHSDWPVSLCPCTRRLTISVARDKELCVERGAIL